MSDPFLANPYVISGSIYYHLTGCVESQGESFCSFVDLSFVVGSFGGSFDFHLRLEQIVVDRNSCVTSCEEVNCHCRIAKVGVMYVKENSSWP